MADQESERFNPELNVGARQADERFRFDPMALRRAEQQGTDSEDQYDNTDEARDQEHQPQDTTDSFAFKDKNEQAEGGKRSGRLGGMFKMRHMLQKGGPAAFIAGALMGGGLILNTFMAPAMMINHVAERLTETFNVQEVTRPVRSSKLGVMKYSSSKHIGKYSGNLLEEGKRTFGFSKKKHRFSSVSKAQIERFKQNDIKIETEDGLFGRKRIKSVTIEDPSLQGGKATFDTPDGLRAAIDANPVIADKVQTAGRGRWGLMFDRVTAKVKAKLGILFKPLVAKLKPDADDASKPKPGGDQKPDKAKTDADADVNSKQAMEAAHNDLVNKGATPDTDSMLKAVDGMGEAGKDVVDDLDNAKKTGHESNGAASKIFALLGFMNDGCTFYQVASRAIYLAKTLKALQLARYAGTFLTMASALKAGDATEEQISYFANKMTATSPITRDVNGSRVITGYEPTATDSQGFYYTMTGLMGEPNESTRKYQMGVNDPGAIRTFLDVRNQIDKLALGKFNLNQFCNVMTSPFMSIVQGGVAMLSCIAGCAGLFGSVALSVGQMAVFASAQKWLSDSIQRMLGGNTANAKTKGEDMGNALTSGSGYFLGKTANAGGHMPMTKELALGFLEERDRYIAKQADIIRATHSPLDTSTRHTMMGSIASGLMPYMARMQSFTGRLGSLLSYAKSSVLPNIMPRVSALSDADKLATRKATLDICADPEYRIFGKDGTDKDIDIHKGQSVVQRTNGANEKKYYSEGNSVGIDPFCNWIFGIPSHQLNSSEYDPMNVIEFFAPGTFQRDDKGKLIPKLVDYGMTCKDNKDFMPPKFKDGKPLPPPTGATCFDGNGKPSAILGSISSYIQSVMSKGYLMPVNESGPCSFWPIISTDKRQLLLEPGKGYYYTLAQRNNPCFERTPAEGEEREKTDGYHGYHFWWEIDDREDKCRYQVKSEYHPGAMGSGHYSIKEEKECPPLHTMTCDKSGKCTCYAPPEEDCLPKNRKKLARIEYKLKAIKENPLSRFKYNCINRGELPFGQEELTDEADPEEKEKQMEEDREIEGETVAERNFGSQRGYVTDKGEECILNGNKDRTMFALYFMDERIQCMLDGDQDCDANAMPMMGG